MSSKMVWARPALERRSVPPRAPARRTRSRETGCATRNAGDALIGSRTPTLTRVIARKMTGPHHIAGGQTWSGTIHCSWPDPQYRMYVVMVEKDLGATLSIDETQGSWVRGHMTVDWQPSGKSEEKQWDIISGYQLPNQEVTILFASGSEVETITGYTNFGENGDLLYEGTADMAPDQGGPRGTTCSAVKLKLVSGPSEDISKAWDKCTQITNRSVCANTPNCSYQSFDASPITCWYLPESEKDLPKQSKCTYLNMNVQGKGPKTKKFDAGGEKDSCACRDWCTANYDSNTGPYFVYEYHVEKKEDTHVCQCFNKITAVTPADEGEAVYTGDVVEGFWKVFDNDRR
eukprot:TRINITY_DN543_c0_g1_i2.p1 TRINITY_DN543_c0_g1~~TRINITY_DN543_c0_g1_i2.p1  ORF type:complete len:346 (-),score=60.56 TRINITY_DN543_c0_g1_i2:88-1125(-)